MHKIKHFIPLCLNQVGACTYSRNISFSLECVCLKNILVELLLWIILQCLLLIDSVFCLSKTQWYENFVCTNWTLQYLMIKRVRVLSHTTAKGSYHQPLVLSHFYFLGRVIKGPPQEVRWKEFHLALIKKRQDRLFTVEKW